MFIQEAEQTVRYIDPNGHVYGLILAIAVVVIIAVLIIAAMAYWQDNRRY